MFYRAGTAKGAGAEVDQDCNTDLLGVRNNIRATVATCGELSLIRCRLSFLAYVLIIKQLIPHRLLFSFHARHPDGSLISVVKHYV